MIQRTRLRSSPSPEAAPPGPQEGTGAPVRRTPLHVSRADDREPQHEQGHNKPRRTRRRKGTTQDNMFDLPVDEIPSDLTYEWKRLSNLGMEDPFYIAGLREQGWEPVPPSRHPNWVPPGYNQPNIIKGGLILMDRPKELTDEARREERQLARQQVREAEQRLGVTPKGELTRQHEGVTPRVTKEMVRPILVEEE